MNINSLVIKTASRCNLNCSYCYVYNMGDNSYLKQPKFMSFEDANILIDRVIEHCLSHKLSYFEFIFHGGEPLLQKMSFYDLFVKKANILLSKEHDVKCFYSLQTNGVLLSREWCELFNRLNIAVGISLDGKKEINDRFRVDHQGKGSYDNVIKGIRIGEKYLTNNVGILSVIDIASDPIEMYEFIKDSCTSKSIDLLWPIASNDKPPTELNSGTEDNKDITPFADWLIIIFDFWFKERKDTKIEIRIFKYIINLILGNENFSNEDFGIENNELLSVEANGEIGVVGDFNICGDNFVKNDARIQAHSFDEVLTTDLGKLYYAGNKKLNKKCLACPVVDICGGGHITSRYSEANGFNNVSVYCMDRMKLITHIQNTIFESLPNKYKEQFNKMEFADVKSYVENMDMDQLKDPNYIEEISSF